jgi:hypothetical protein
MEWNVFRANDFLAYDFTANVIRANVIRANVFHANVIEPFLAKVRVIPDFFQEFFRDNLLEFIISNLKRQEICKDI